VSQATGVVVVFCVLAGLYLAFFDWAFAELVKALL
jgi:preprotein translocase subunit SecE